MAKVGATVFDPLMGTGAYLEGALKLGRRVIGVEINEKTYNIAKQDFFCSYDQNPKLKRPLLS